MDVESNGIAAEVCKAEVGSVKVKSAVAVAKASLEILAHKERSAPDNFLFGYLGLETRIGSISESVDIIQCLIGIKGYCSVG